MQPSTNANGVTLTCPYTYIDTRWPTLSLASAASPTYVTMPPTISCEPTRDGGATSNMPIPCGILHQCQASSMAPSTRRHPRQRSRGQHPLYRWYVGTTPTFTDDKSAFTLVQGARHPSTMSIHDILHQHRGQYYALIHHGGGILHCYHIRHHTSLCLTRRGTGYHKTGIDGRSDILFP
jgi:hypothetical protein